ncbi:MAG TPA: hypothetical protein VLX91_01960 [Candidatus Acidoferrales bacterium]|nr:hypothetical protein [Candidatus Acidoferrales bacterium]
MSKILVVVITFLVSIQASSQCLQPNLSMGTLYKTTGVPDLDVRINQEGTLIYNVFGVDPNMFLFDDQGSPNAFAAPQVITLVGYTGTVYFGLGLIRDQLWNMNEGGVAVAGIMAHEFAHILQFKNGCQLMGEARELDADFMAGYYLGRKNYIIPTNIVGFANSLFSMGEYFFWSPAHHGTPTERVNAMVTGFRHSSQPLAEAYSYGITYISTTNADVLPTGDGSTDDEVSSSNTTADNNDDESADQQVEVDYHNSHVHWNRTQDNPTVEVERTYKNTGDQPVTCTVNLQCGTVPTDAADDDYSNYVLSDERNFTFELEPGSEHTVSATLTWERPDMTVMPKIRTTIHAAYVH